MTDDALTAAEQRDLPDDDTCEIGVGIISGGVGVNAVYIRRGGRVRLFWKGRGQQGLSHTIEQILAAWQANPDTAVVKVPVPPPGMVTRLREKTATIPVLPVVLGARPSDHAAFVDARTEYLWHMRETIRLGRIDIDPDDVALGEELRALRWEMDARGRLFVMPKMGETVLAEALALCFAPVRIEYPEPRKVGVR